MASCTSVAVTSETQPAKKLPPFEDSLKQQQTRSVKRKARRVRQRQRARATDIELQLAATRALQLNQTIVVQTNSVYECKRLYNVWRKEYPTLRIQMYTPENEEKLKEELKIAIQLEKKKKEKKEEEESEPEDERDEDEIYIDPLPAEDMPQPQQTTTDGRVVPVVDV